MLKNLLLSITLLSVASASAFAAPAAAEFSPFYGVLSLGTAKNAVQGAAVDVYDLGNGFTSSTTATGNSSTVGKIQVGYELGKTFALEAGYNYLGKANFTSITNLGSFSGSRDVSLFNLDVVSKLPLNDRFAILARAGVYYWKTQTELPNAITLGTTRFNDNGYDFKFGAGVQYDFTSRFAMRGEFERFNGVGKSLSGGDAKINQLTVGAVLKF